MNESELLDPAADIELIGELLMEAERHGWRDPASISAALLACKDAFTNLVVTLDRQVKVIEQLTGTADRSNQLGRLQSTGSGLGGRWSTGV